MNKDYITSILGVGLLILAIATPLLGLSTHAAMLLIGIVVVTYGWLQFGKSILVSIAPYTALLILASFIRLPLPPELSAVWRFVFTTGIWLAVLLLGVYLAERKWRMQRH